MTVKELNEQLKKCDPDSLVVMAIDEEGNGYSIFRDIWSENCNYKDGEVGLSYLTDEHRKQGYTEEDILDGQPAIVLWP